MTVDNPRRAFDVRPKWWLKTATGLSAASRINRSACRRARDVDYCRIGRTDDEIDDAGGDEAEAVASRTDADKRTFFPLLRTMAIDRSTLIDKRRLLRRRIEYPRRKASTRKARRTIR